MAIDGCKYNFAQLAVEIFPKYMAELEGRLARPGPMSDFSIGGVGIKTLLRKFRLSNDFAGCYILIDRSRPIYVGISRSIFQRLRQHVRGTTHFDASLAYRIAAARRPRKMTRSAAMEGDDFHRYFEEAQAYIRGLSVAFMAIENPVELYLFEAYCAMELDTSKWNTFATH